PATPPRPTTRHAGAGVGPRPRPRRSNWKRIRRSRDRSAWPWTGCETPASRDPAPALRPPAPRGASLRPLPRRPSVAPPRAPDWRWSEAGGATRGPRGMPQGGRAPPGLGRPRDAAPPDPRAAGPDDPHDVGRQLSSARAPASVPRPGRGDPGESWRGAPTPARPAPGGLPHVGDALPPAARRRSAQSRNPDPG